MLIICTGNTCRSQMAHGLLKSFDKNIEVFSAGTMPGTNINPMAIKVMSELKIDISNHYPRPLEMYLNDDWDYVITVCDQAKESCPVFPGSVRHRLHMGFEDPSVVKGTDEYIMREFRKVRDEIKRTFFKFYMSELISKK